MATSGPTSGQTTTNSLTSDATRLVRDTAYSQIGNQKQKATDLLGDLARAVRSTTRQMGHDDSAVASYANRAADQIDRWTESLRNRELDDIARDVRRFAREQPAVFLGAAFGLGVLASRFLKSSGERARPYGQPAGHEQPSGSWAAGEASSGGASTRPYVAHDMPDMPSTPRLSDPDLDLEG